MADNSLGAKVGVPVVLPNITGPTAYTPTIVSFGTVSNNFATWSGTSSRIRVIGTFIPGTPTAVSAVIPLPSSYTAMNQGATTLVVGRWYRNTPTNGNTKGGSLFIANGSNSVNFGFDGNTNTSGPFTALLGTAIAASGETISYDFTVDVNEVSPTVAYGAGLATSTKSGLVTPRKGQESLTVTSAQPGFTTLRAVGIYYQDQTGNHRFKFNIGASFTNASISALTVSISGVIFKNVGNYLQACSAMAVSHSVAQRSFAVPGTGDVRADTTPATNNSAINISGDVELDAKPSWA